MKIWVLFIKKTYFQNIEQFFPFWTLNSQKVLVFRCLKIYLLRHENFLSLHMANGISKNLPFHSHFKNVIIVKSASIFLKTVFYKLVLYFHSIWAVYWPNFKRIFIYFFLSSFVEAVKNKYLFCRSCGIGLEG